MNFEEFQKCDARVTLSLFAGKRKPVRVEKTGFPPEVFYQLSEQCELLRPPLKQLDDRGDKYTLTKK